MTDRHRAMVNILRSQMCDRHNYEGFIAADTLMEMHRKGLVDTGNVVEEVRDWLFSALETNGREAGAIQALVKWNMT